MLGLSGLFLLFLRFEGRADGFAARKRVTGPYRNVACHTAVFAVVVNTIAHVAGDPLDFLTLTGIALAIFLVFVHLFSLLVWIYS